MTNKILLAIKYTFIQFILYFASLSLLAFSAAVYSSKLNEFAAWSFVNLKSSLFFGFIILVSNLICSFIKIKWIEVAVIIASIIIYLLDLIGVWEIWPIKTIILSFVGIIIIVLKDYFVQKRNQK